MDIAVQILTRFAMAEEVNISIKKLHPPIANFEGSAGVSFELKRS
jgi:dihydroneopterin aldolase